MGKVSQEDFDDLKQKVEKLADRVQKLEKVCAGNAAGDDTALCAWENREFEKNLEQIKQDYSQKLLEKENEIKALRARCDETEKSRQEVLHFVEKLQKEKSDCRQELERLKAKPQAAVPNLEELVHIWSVLSEVEETTKELLTQYYCTDNFIVFLMQCGQFSLLNQFWGACKENVLNKQTAPKVMKVFLLFMLSLYNKANKGSEAREIIAEAGAKYNFEEQQRIGENGSTVKEMLLPGLCSPSGKISHKALVVL